MDNWADQDWQARAETGRDLGGRHLPNVEGVELVRKELSKALHPSRMVCPECGSTTVQQRRIYTGKGRYMNDVTCLACEYLISVAVEYDDV